MSMWMIMPDVPRRAAVPQPRLPHASFAPCGVGELFRTIELARHAVYIVWLTLESDGRDGEANTESAMPSLQWGHGLSAVDIRQVKGKKRQLGVLQWGHGLSAVEIVCD